MSELSRYFTPAELTKLSHQFPHLDFCSDFCGDDGAAHGAFGANIISRNQSAQTETRNALIRFLADQDYNYARVCYENEFDRVRDEYYERNGVTLTDRAVDDDPRVRRWLGIMSEAESRA